MRRTAVAASLTLAVVVSAGIDTPAVGRSFERSPSSAQRRGCRKLYTVAMGRRAGFAVYARTRRVTERELLMLGRIEKCQRIPFAQRYVRWFDRHQAQLHAERVTATQVDAYGQWAIPEPIVRCESGGHNDSPNGAGASGYYQILGPGSTWSAYGGDAYASQAYLASKQGQDVVASKIWDHGRGAHQWVCAGLTGY